MLSELGCQWCTYKYPIAFSFSCLDREGQGRKRDCGDVLVVEERGLRRNRGKMICDKLLPASLKKMQQSPPPRAVGVVK